MNTFPCGHRVTEENIYRVFTRGRQRDRCRECHRAAHQRARDRAKLCVNREMAAERFFAPDPTAPHFGDHSRCDLDNGTLCPECSVLWSDVKVNPSGEVMA